MAIGLVRANSVFGVEEEVTEGTYVVPSAATKYVQLLEGFDMKPSREVIDRGLITASPGKETPRLGIKSVAGSWPVEYRGAGIEGGETDFDSLLKCALGARRQNTTRVTCKSSGNTSTVLAIEDADITKFAVGDSVLVMKSGAHEVRPIVSRVTTPGSATVTLAWALDGGAPGNSVQVAKFTTYYTADSGHVSLSLSQYIGNEIRRAALGARISSMALENFQTGKVASLNFGFEGINFTEIDGAAPHTPTYDVGVPPIILNACVWRSGVAVQVGSLGMDLKNELGKIDSTCSSNGRTGTRVKGRDITGSFNPYKDDTAVTRFDAFVAGTEFSLFAVAYTPSSTSGEMALGSIIALWLPQCIAVDFGDGDADGIVTEETSFRATRGGAGTSEEMYLTQI